MSKVIFLGYLFQGHINPTLGLVNELVNRGEEVIYYSGKEFCKKIEATGAKFRDYGFIQDPSESNKTQKVQGNLDAFAQVVTWVLNVGKQIISNISSEIEADRPDYIIHDSQAFWGKRIAGSLGIPAVSSIASFALTGKMLDIDPDFFIENMLRMPNASLFAKKKSNIVRLLDLLSRRISAAYDEPDFNIYDFANNTGKLNIVYTSEYFQPYGEVFDDSFKFVGHSIFKRTENVDFPFDKLGSLPLIYIALGTVRTNRLDFYRECFSAFGDMEIQVVLSVGTNVDVYQLGKIPDNFIVRNYVPQLEILKYASVFITHGGTNSVNEGLYNNVPLIVYPQGDDNHIVAGRVENLGAGIYLKNDDINAEELKNAISRVLSDENFKINSKAIGDTLKTAGGYLRAVDEIFKFKGELDYENMV
ncbi:macrolide family glycosyltransferase [Ruminiclostridium cellulolyticum]|uniref:Glycosyltransferase, MGT family n=1 Tax=Ruminiclostridium cellulolyticum (strain ATCC 35319 / DSM 5812 / JCM 6584 / H10) TaxID=394503 RepID=B8I974_RUMCH|nr:macrolide family glycosyltransferase [Ruminiclostridium cellulolyticum]ACL75334.1 glycosyltransferase, MGT family [Ruminiclostridium cellulolyticum H10]